MYQLLMVVHSDDVRDLVLAQTTLLNSAVDSSLVVKKVEIKEVDKPVPESVERLKGWQR